MLKNINKNVSGDLIKVLMDMGHSDEIVIADGNFPRWAHPKIVVEAIGFEIPPLLDAILSLMPLDKYVEKATTLMAVAEGDTYNPQIWQEYRTIASRYEEAGLREEVIERFDFYERSKNSYALITTSEKSLYANIILKKGVL